MTKLSIRIINFNDCKTEKMKETGLGGIRSLVTTKENISYVVKPENLNQTLNEVMAQILIKSLGLTSIDYAFVKIGETYYGSLKYVDGLICLSSKNYHLLNKCQKIEFLKHLFLNSYIVNSDIMGEIYLTKDGKVISLDYGEAGVDIPLFNIDKQTEEAQNVLLTTFLKKTESDYISNYILQYIKIAKDYFLDASLTIDDLKELISFMIEGMINANYKEYKNFLEILQMLHSELNAYIYQEYINGLIETAEEIKKNLKTYWSFNFLASQWEM